MTTAIVIRDYVPRAGCLDIAQRPVEIRMASHRHSEGPGRNLQHWICATSHKRAEIDCRSLFEAKEVPLSNAI